MSRRPRISFLGPPGTFSDDALRTAAAGAGFEPAPESSILDALRAVRCGESTLALVPFENSTEGSVRPTLDALAFDVEGIAIIGEYDHPISLSLIARDEIALEAIGEVASHPQAAAQCARFLRAKLPDARVVPASSTAEAVRSLRGDESDGRAALGAASAAEIYGATVLAEGVEDDSTNLTRFVWIATQGTPRRAGGLWRTTLIFSELGEDHPGALVDALVEFSSRGVNLTRIESRPRRAGLGRYMFFVDLDGAAGQPGVDESIHALRSKADSVRVLGSYPVGGVGLP
ncbi:MAG: prephenate dehydratase [Solirubrobacterales bacterium]|nr:prephenate dehydratase [Solirubrobacterales bacterium]